MRAVSHSRAQARGGIPKICVGFLGAFSKKEMILTFPCISFALFAVLADAMPTADLLGNPNLVANNHIEDVEKIDFTIKCEGFDYSKDMGKDGDLYVVMQMDRPNPHGRVTQRTDVAPNKREYDFPKRLRFPFVASEKAQVIVYVYDQNVDRETDDLMFKSSFKMANAIKAMNNHKKLVLTDKLGHSSTCTVVPSTAEDGSLLLFNAYIVNMPWKRNSICLTDDESGPRFYIKTPLHYGNVVEERLVYESEDVDLKVKDEMLLEYKQFGLQSTALRNDKNPEKTFKIIVTCKPEKAGVEEVVLGETANINVRDFMEGSGLLAFDIVGTRGKIMLQSELAPTYLEYIQGGVQLKMHAAFDFTGSNIDVVDQKSLHYVKQVDNLPTNDYLDAGKSVYETLAPMAQNNAMTLYEFGGKELKQCSPLGPYNLKPLCGDSANTVTSLEEFQQTYVKAVKQYAPKSKSNPEGGLRELSAYTHFAPIINKVAEGVRKKVGEPVYHVLTIFTDGVLHDFKETKDAIVAASSLPMSIIIIGIGSEDFKKMNALDADDEPYLFSSAGKRAERDIVNFVPYRESIKISLENFIDSIFEEVPLNVVQYYHTIGISPSDLNNLNQVVGRKAEIMREKDLERAEVIARFKPKPIFPPTNINRIESVCLETAEHCRERPSEGRCCVVS
eukprot:Partr_v1_DN28866_c0_g1_i6_m33187 putative copine family